MRAATAFGIAELIEAARDDQDALPLHVELAPERLLDARWPMAGSAPASLWAHVERAGPALRSRLDGVAALGVTTDASGAREASTAWGSDVGPHAPPVFDPERSRQDPQAPRRHYERVFVSGARWAERVFGEGLGVIEAGSPADLILVDYHPATELDARTWPEHLATAIGRTAVSGAMVAGEIVMDHGVLVTVDELEVAARARECARRIRQRL